ncbi:hypothetical protein [Phenylobacterium sp.]|uniref:hypothetical protein n=1 Tax=Phenylobacterium sp. TaxID=1871053 RepID=UPI00356497DB
MSEIATLTVSPPAEALVRQLLAWVAERPRTYGEAMDAWRTSCPRLPVWEDAVDFRLIEVAAPPAVRLSDRPVQLTARGRAFLEAA